MEIRKEKYLMDGGILKNFEDSDEKLSFRIYSW